MSLIFWSSIIASLCFALSVSFPLKLLASPSSMRVQHSSSVLTHFLCIQMHSLVLLCCLLGVAQLIAPSVAAHGELDLDSEPWTNYTQTQYWLSQKLDHFDLADTRVWSQRYWVVDDFWYAHNCLFKALCIPTTCIFCAAGRLALARCFITCAVRCARVSCFSVLILYNISRLD
jgi:hypothetical protein